MEQMLFKAKSCAMVFASSCMTTGSVELSTEAEFSTSLCSLSVLAGEKHKNTSPDTDRGFSDRFSLFWLFFSDQSPTSYWVMLNRVSQLEA